ncbi:MAG: hypothetical protein GWP03_07175 [Proteobacteria bacterium]|nr:hypothetical protein [Pseudomonadota bacterium]
MSELYSLRKVYGETLTKIADKYPEIVVLDADLAKSNPQKHRYLRKNTLNDSLIWALPKQIW